jgi:hypothetical protein
MRVTRSLFPLIILWCGHTTAAPVDRIRAFDDRRTTTLTNHVHSSAVAANDRGAVDPAMLMDHMILGIKLTASQQADLDGLLTDQQNPSSPNFHKMAEAGGIRQPFRLERQR